MSVPETRNPRRGPGWLALGAVMAIAAAMGRPGATQTAPAPAQLAPAQVAGPPAGGKAAPPRPAAPRQMVIQGDNITHSDATGEGTAENVVVTDPDGAVITARSWKWNDRQKVAHAEGELHLADDQMEGTADAVEVQYARSKRILVLTGKVHLTLKPKSDAPPVAPAPTPAPKPAPVKVADGKAVVETPDRPSEPQARRFPIEVTCDRVVYAYAKETRHAALTGDFVAIQKTDDGSRTVKAASAEWFGVDERVLLKAPVRFSDTKGRHGETEQDAEISTRKGAEGIRMKRSVIRVPVDDDDAAPAGGKPAGGKPADGKPADGKPADGKPADGPLAPKPGTPAVPPAARPAAPPAPRPADGATASTGV